MRRIIEFLQERATGRTVLILFVITTMVYGVILLYTIPAVLKLAPGMELFDMSPAGYSPEYAGKLLEAIGEYGRQTYLVLQLPIDFVYPGLFAATYTLILTWLFLKGFSRSSSIFYLALLPAAAGLCDYLENIGIILMLRSYPNLSPGLVMFSSASSVAKSVFTIGTYLLLLVGLIGLVRQRMHKNA